MTCSEKTLTVVDACVGNVVVWGRQTEKERNDSSTQQRRHEMERMNELENVAREMLHKSST